MGRFPARFVESVHRIGRRMEARSPGAEGAPEERWQRIRRVAAVSTISLAALIVLYLLLFGGGSTYTVTAAFQNASQLVTGNNVTVAGVPVGQVKEISLADDGEALVKLEISDSAYTPLPQGTHAQVRSQSLSGIANRYVDRTRTAQPSPQRISSGGEISQADTTSEVDIAQLFNT